MEKKRLFEKFTIRKQTMIWSVAVLVLCFVMYIILEFFIQITSSQSPYLATIKSATLVMTSIMGTTVFTAFLIEKNSKNALFSDIITNDVLSSPEIYLELSEENRRTLLSNLEKNIYFDGGERKEEMYASIRDKLKRSPEQQLYYESCKYTINCKVYKDRVEKDILRTTAFRSYNPVTTISNLPLLASTSRKMAGIETLQMESLVISGFPQVSIADINIQKKDVSGDILKKCGYDERTECVYRNDLTFYNHTDTIITLKYKTVTPRDDCTYSCRVRYPCKNFTLSFRMNYVGKEKFKVSAHAFGFCDDGAETPNNSSDDEVTISFKDWIFHSDGVAIVFTKK